ncbi:MAG: VIT domain-containing protein [Xanthomonadales bacterium]|nr:VIT domain-containing protein [Xanthomonadales bacterium]
MTRRKRLMSLNYRDRILLGLVAYFAVALGIRAWALDEPPAQNWDQLTAGTLLIQQPGNEPMLPAARLHTDVSIRVSGMVAEVNVSQQFRNDSNDFIEAIYAFPLPDNAAVNRMTLRTADRLIEGEIQEKQQARATYRKARDEGRRASLVSQRRPNLFTTRIANVAPLEEVSVDITYVQELTYRSGQFSLRFPMTITPRYGESLSSGPSGPEMLPALPGEVPNPVTLELELVPGFDLVRLESLYHDVALSDSGGVFRVALDDPVPANRDFEMVWEPGLADVPRSAVFAESTPDGEFALVMVMPPATHRAQPGQRELILVIDTSGSMYGESLEQAKESLLMALGSLDINDRFNVIAFDSEVEPLFSTARQASSENLGEAIGFVDGLQADGGTQIGLALGQALADSAPAGMLRQVVFITDGSVDHETALFKRIQSELGDSRLFTVGIGPAPNVFFMRKAAQFGRGSFTLIGSTDQVAEKMDQLLQRLENPVLTELCMDWNQPADSYPRHLPDLYLGEPLIVSTRLSELKGDLQVCGETSQDSWHEWVSLKRHDQSAGIGTLWARRKIDSLMDDLALGGDAEAIREEVLTVALDHSLVSRYTSFVAVDRRPVRALADPAKSVQLPNLAPGGLDMTLPVTATDSLSRIVFGLALLMLTGVFSLRLRSEV